MQNQERQLLALERQHSDVAIRLARFERAIYGYWFLLSGSSCTDHNYSARKPTFAQYPKRDGPLEFIDLHEPCAAAAPAPHDFQTKTSITSGLLRVSFPVSADDNQSFAAAIFTGISARCMASVASSLDRLVWGVIQHSVIPFELRAKIKNWNNSALWLGSI